MKALTIASLLAGLAVTSPASADVIFNVVQTSPTWSNPASPYASSPTIGIVTSVTVMVTDDAARNGFFVRASQGYGPSVVQTNGLLGLFVSVFNGPFPGGTLSYTLANFTTPDPRQPSSPQIFNFGFGANPDGLLSGSLYFNNTNDEARFVFDATSRVQGMFGSDGTGACWYGGCTFTGEQQRLATAVPEPATLALFGTALAGLALARRRKG